MRSPSCPWHALAAPDRLRELAYDHPVRELIAEDTVLELPWPICLLARCRRCGSLAEPMRRTARVRRTLPCPRCGEPGTLEPLRSLASLGPAHPLACRTLRELGLPERHLYYLRQAIRAIEPG